MTTPSGRNVPGRVYNNQHSTPGPGGVVNANQGTQNVYQGGQTFNTINANNTIHATPVRPKGIQRDTKVLLILLVIDIAWFVWGMTAYTGLSGDTGDLVRSIGFLILFAMTIRLFVNWVRRRLQ
ncbi:MAG TPA: hypothetical protein VFV67_06005 [Actinophytocola sp.]|uniref:hypothetical protein n=1 Tax=Actinophytocola sp. TaxID=1872138 RepID=UPI002DB98AAA|nr:hypothetical protein [Actinophytocola sp.]HEU5470188.1 hypothetical protein [Actinophytocola sp.]